MWLPADLLQQANELASVDRRGVPRQVNLRRSISAAYYALFHLLIHHASLQCSPAAPAGLRFRIQRAFEHSRMKSACRAASRHRDLPASLSDLLQPVGYYPEPIRKVAATFVQLQEARHAADYDTTLKYSRSEANQLIELVEEAFHLWEDVKDSEAVKVFLAALLLQDKWDR